MYSRQTDDLTLEMGVSGKLVMNALAMYDRQTGTLWTQLTGEAIEGPLAGEKLEFLPSWMTTWSDWKERHPNTLALVKRYAGRRSPYWGYFFSSQAGVTSVTNFDRRLPNKRQVIGVAAENGSTAYPFDVLRKEVIVNDSAGDVPVLVVFDAETSSGVAFDRRVNGQTLTFQLDRALQLIDEQTESLWNGVEGIAITGPLEGTRLERVMSTTAFWFGWKDYHPETRVYSID